MGSKASLFEKGTFKLNLKDAEVNQKKSEGWRDSGRKISMRESSEAGERA